MSLALIYTLLQKVSTNIEFDKIPEKFMNYCEKQYKDNSYNILSQTIGLHVNATRRHFHIAQYVDTNVQKQIKNWDKKILPLFTEFKKQHKDILDMKLSVRQSTDDDFDLQKLHAYPLKEYESITDVKHRELCFPFDDNQLNDLRKYSNQIYQVAKYEYERKKEKEIIENDNVENKYNYLDKKLEEQFNDYKDKHNWIHHTDYTVKLRQIQRYLLQYQKLQFEENNKRTFKLSAIKDLSISYLYFRNYATEDDLIGPLHF